MLQRVVHRDRVSDEDARKRLASQWPIERKKRLATHTIENGGTLAAFEYQVGQWWRSNQKRFSFSLLPTFLSLLLSSAVCLFFWLLFVVLPWLGGSGASASAAHDVLAMTSAPRG